MKDFIEIKAYIAPSNELTRIAFPKDDIKKLYCYLKEEEYRLEMLGTTIQGELSNKEDLKGLLLKS